MVKRNLLPDFIFESSWEVCNKVGGIYTVLSTRARTLHDLLGDQLIFIGPGHNDEATRLYFEEDKTLFPDWVKEAQTQGLLIKVGRWSIPGYPIAILVDFTPFYNQKNDIYAKAWEHFEVDSLHAYGDYDEASMFSYAAAKVVESFYYYALTQYKNVVYHANEWMTALGMLYLQRNVPAIATIFTTHATSIGRSIAGNMKPLYDYLPAYNGDQMALELNMQSKHSVEKQAAHYADCFTTVSDITATECSQLLDKTPHVVLPNGFENSFVPTGAQFSAVRRVARKKLLQVANALTGIRFEDKKTVIVSTAGRYEFRNKGIDVFLDALNMLYHEQTVDKRIVAFIEVPAWVGNARSDLQARLETGKTFTSPLDNPVVTHHLHNDDTDQIISMLRRLNIHNAPDRNTTVIFVPCYLTGHDGILNLSYYDTIIGNDLTVYPSYYEPWGYTPLESIAFKVPCITTTLAGFGLWAQHALSGKAYENRAVTVIERTDGNYAQVAREIKEAITNFANLDNNDVAKARKQAGELSKKALWKHFITYYLNAYHVALENRNARTAQY